MKRSVVLLSGGLDSTVALACALRETLVVLCLTFDYGQRAAAREVAAAAAIARHYGVPHRTVALPFLGEITSTALVNRKAAVPAPDPRDLRNSTVAHQTARAVWVPNRNGVFVNVAAAFAEALGAGVVVTGFNREEGETFPDNSATFVAAANRALGLSTLRGVKLVSYTQQLDKAEIAALGRRLNIPWPLIWSCYHGEDEPCGRCESCLRLAAALEGAD
jgi:7-cyano-7-deazaguanine synthase